MYTEDEYRKIYEELEELKIINKKLEKKAEKLEELEQKVEKLEELEEKNEELEEKNKKFMNNNFYINMLYYSGIKKLSFYKTVTNVTKPKTTHKPVIQNNNNKIFNILTNIQDYINTDNISEISSSFLNKCKYDNYAIEFGDESDIQSYINLYIADLIISSTLKLKTTSGSAKNMTESNNKRNKSDIWAILRDDYRPILPVEIKPPIPTSDKKNEQTNNDVFNNKISGQLYDYMITLKYFYNQKYVFGILTTLDEWKIYWLPNTDNCAENDTLFNMYEDIENEVINIRGRIVHSSRIYKHTEKDLAKVLLSVLVKCYYSPKFPVELVSDKRIYIKLTKDTWKWVQYSSDFINKITNNLKLSFPDNRVTNFSVLRFFKGGEYSKIRLILANNGSIFVLKEFLNSENDYDKDRGEKDENDEIIINDDDDSYEIDDDNDENFCEQARQEKKCWQQINNIPDVKLIKLVRRDCLMMPLVFHIHVDRQNKIISIPLDLKLWCVDDKAIPGELPPILENLNDQLKNFKVNIHDVIDDAIYRCAKQKYIHNDLEFRHIGLYPVIEKIEGSNFYKIKRLKSVLIDFEKMKKVNSYSQAMDKMDKRIDDLYKEYKNDKYKFR